MEEEIALLEEQLASAHADIERLQGEVAEAVASAATHESAAADLRRQLTAAQTDLAARDEALAASAVEVASLQTAATAADARAQGAAQRYRDAVLAAAPDLPADLIAGDSVEAIDAAVTRARETVAQVRQHLEQQAQSLRVPAGSPPRTPPDLGDLTAAEKIRAGLAAR